MQRKANPIPADLRVLGTPIGTSVAYEAEGPIQHAVGVGDIDGGDRAGSVQGDADEGVAVLGDLEQQALPAACLCIIPDGLLTPVRCPGYAVYCAPESVTDCAVMGTWGICD
jgi:hypothetical protein